MIIGTAGHIDHGKTSLVKALTGVDADRLPEEKKRGITIDLGFAYAPLPNGDVIGFVDVPGHEKFVHTMAAGACGMDHGLVVIAADDGIMPQTREHVRILDLLGVSGVTVALTKADLVDSERMLALNAEIEHEFSSSRFANSPVFAVSTRTDEGIESLRNHLFNLTAPISNRVAEYFRLAIDRVFVVKGLGVGVTGAVNTGQIKVGDTLTVPRTGREVKVRSIHAQNRPVEHAGPGTRCGIVLSGVEVEEVERGDWLLAPEIAHTTSRIDCKITVPLDAVRSLKDGELVLLHHGTTHVSARLIFLNAIELLPGQTSFAQCVLARALPLFFGDRLVLRDGSARHTLSGARVLDTRPPVRGRKKPFRLKELEVLSVTEADVALAGLIDLSISPINLSHWSIAMNRRLLSLQSSLDVADVLIVDGQSFVSSHAFASQLRTDVIECLMHFHATDMDEPGLGVERLRRMCHPELTQRYFQVWIKLAIEQGLVAITGSFIHMPDHRVMLSEAEQVLWQKVYPLLQNAEFDAPWVRDVAQSVGAPEDCVRMLFRKLAKQSDLVQVVKDLFYPHATMQRIAALMQQLVQQNGFISVVAFRDQLGIGRKRAIQLLEALDRIGFSRRVVAGSGRGGQVEKDQRMIRNADLFG